MLKKKGTAWWFIDPNGTGTLLIGVNGVRRRGFACVGHSTSPYQAACNAKYGSAQAWAESSVQRLAE